MRAAREVHNEWIRSVLFESEVNTVVVQGLQSVEELVYSKEWAGITSNEAEDVQDIVWNSLIWKSRTQRIIKVGVFFRHSKVEEILFLEEMVIVGRHLLHDLLDPIASLGISCYELIFLEAVVEDQGVDSGFTVVIVVLVQGDTISVDIGDCGAGWIVAGECWALIFLVIMIVIVIVVVMIVVIVVVMIIVIIVVVIVAFSSDV